MRTGQARDTDYCYFETRWTEREKTEENRVAIYVLYPSGLRAAILIFLTFGVFRCLFQRTTGRVDRRRCKAKMTVVTC